MKLSLDTHVVLWWYQEPEKLSEELRLFLKDKGNVVFVSAAVLWEIAIKTGIGKLKAPSKLFEHIKKDFEEMPILWSHTMELQKLESIHRDPFDRLLIAQAKVEGLTLLTRDKNILKYPINLMVA